ncbi:PEP-CTERM sorting domain-containing protein [Crateriforma conspicua]|uniref:PEP-CTERM sorting domain-containing protein n=1 Tax=Crateriforma conspicua TaxID=2527996 RepID=UPI00118927D1|nr:PEP-CTERM sorting domain-containing protein [Crateriforma conspicua]QDV66154.1 hypothetical protein Mal65_53290 [Crateriforma conspicua]
MRLLSRVISALAATVVVAGSTFGNAVFTVQPEVFNASLDAGSFVIGVRTTDGPAAVGSFDLDLRFSNFQGSLSTSNTLTIDSIVAGAGFQFLAPPSTGVVTDPSSIVLQGTGDLFSGGTSLMATDITFATVNFSYADPIAVGDSFVVDFEPADQTVGITGAFENGYAGISPGVVAVPEPGTFALCGLIGAGVAGRRWRKRKSVA